MLLLLLLFLMLAMMTVFDRFELHSPWMFPEIAVFCMLGIFESCVRSRLIPSNENYGPFFEHFSFPALITDRTLRPAFRTATGGSIPTQRLFDAADAPCELADGRVLHGRRLSIRMAAEAAGMELACQSAPVFSLTLRYSAKAPDQ